MVMRKLGASTKPTLIISHNADTWKIKSESSVKTTEYEFQFGKEFDETTADGRKVKVYNTFVFTDLSVRKDLESLSA